MRLRIRIQDPARSGVEQHDARRGAIEDGAIAGFAGGRGRGSAAQPAAVGVPGGNHDADEQRDPADEVAHALLAVLHDGARQGGVQHRERMVVDGVEAQLAFDDVVRAAQDAAAIGRDQQFRFLGHDRAIVEHGEMHVELGVGADAGDFRGADATREHQRAARGAAAIAAQDRVRGDDVRHAVDLHQSQRAFLIEHGAHDRRQAVDLGDDRFARGMAILRVVGVVLERRQQLLFRIEQPDQVDVHFVEAGLGEVLVLEIRVERRHVRIHVVPAREVARDGFDFGVLRDQRLAHDLDAARNLVLLDVLELAQDEVTGRGPGAEYDQRGS